MKTYKKMISMMLSLIIALNICIFVNAEDDTANPTEIYAVSSDELVQIKGNNSLLTENQRKLYLEEVFDSLHIPTRIIDYMSNERINTLVESDEFKVAISIEAETSKTRDGNNEEDIQGSMKKYIMWSRKPWSSDETDNNYKYSFLVWYEWLSIPIWRLKDTISVDCGTGSIVNGSQEALLTYILDDTENAESFDYNDNEYCGVGTACIFSIDLPNNISGLTDMGIIVCYDVRTPRDDITVFGQYFHKIIACTTGISLGDDLGISVSPAAFHVEYPIQCGIDPA